VGNLYWVWALWFSQKPQLRCARYLHRPGIRSIRGRLSALVRKLGL